MSASKLTKNITAHAWNGSGDRVALCPNSNEIHIYAYQGGKFTLEKVLKEHDQLVSGIDWHPKTDLIVSCSHDRNALVWTRNGSEYEPSLCILQINRAATCVQWSPRGDKFAVGSGSKEVTVCSFEEQNNWWVPKKFVAHDSTVLSVAWHPNNVFLATGSSDCTCRVYSGYLKSVDGSMADQQKLGTQFSCYRNSTGWVNDVAWSPSGEYLAFCGHDSTVHIAAFAAGEDASSLVQTIRYSDLPFRSLTFIHDRALVAAGFSANPTIITNKKGDWCIDGVLDKPAKKEESKASSSAEGSSVRAAFARFQQADSFGKHEAAGSSSSSVSKTIHTNPIVGIRAISSVEPISKISTCGLDGRIVVWNLETIEDAVAALRL